MAERTEKSFVCSAISMGFVISLLLFFGSTVASTSSQRRIDFNREIRPILSDKCFVCHGPDAPSKKIKLRLDSEESAKSDLGRGRRAITPGSPAQSELVRRITSTDDLMRMPPADSGHQLTKDEIALLIAWVEQGAVVATPLVIYRSG
jgi:uncharacterized membrane protein